MRKIDGSEFTDCTFAAKSKKRAKGCRGMWLGTLQATAVCPFTITAQMGARENSRYYRWLST